MKKSKFEVGEQIIFRKGYSDYQWDSNYGGGGYADYEGSLTIKSISHFDAGFAYFFENWTNGVYEYAIEALSSKRNMLIDEILENE